jgi:hypothetical protein
MDIISIIEIAVAVVAVFFIIKFIVSPVIKIIVGIILILVFAYVLQKYFGFNIDKALAPMGISLNLNSWGPAFNWISSPLSYAIDQIQKLFDFISGNFPKLQNINTPK